MHKTFQAVSPSNGMTRSRSTFGNGVVLVSLVIGIHWRTIIFFYR